MPKSNHLLTSSTPICMPRLTSYGVHLQLEKEVTLNPHEAATLPLGVSITQEILDLLPEEVLTRLTTTMHLQLSLVSDMTLKGIISSTDLIEIKQLDNLSIDVYVLSLKPITLPAGTTIAVLTLQTSLAPILLTGHSE